MRTAGLVERIVPVVVLACVLAGCGSDSVDVQDASEETTLSSESTEGASADGYPLPDCSDANGEPCITNGFDPSIDGFGFANWGGVGAIGVTEMVALFGRKRVCASGSGSTCVMYPAAKQWADQVNEAMAGGHCEGMAVLSTRLFRGDDAIDQLDPNAGATIELDPSDRDVISAIEMWFATQYLDPVVSAYTAYQELTPTEIASALIDGLAEGSGYTVGIYSEAGGHAVTPLGVGFVGDQVAISIYDNNYPGTVQRIMIDPDQETWSYAAGTTEPNAPTGGWEGGTGTIELTPMESRALPAPAPFSEKRGKGRKADKTQTVLVTSPDPQTIAGAVLTMDGVSYDLTDPAVLPPPGVGVRSIRSNTLSSGSTIVDIDADVVTDYTITATTKNPSGATVPVTISLDAIGEPRIMMRADSPSNGSGVARFSVDDSGQVDADTTDGTSAEVSVANGLREAAFDLDGENSLAFDTDENGLATVIIFDDEGEALASFEVDGETEDGSVVYSDVEYDPETGELDVTEVEAEAEEVDTDWLSGFDDLANDGSAEANAGDVTDEGSYGGGTDDGSAEVGTDPGTDDGSAEVGTDPGTDDGSAEVDTDPGTDDGSAEVGTDPGTDDGSPNVEGDTDAGRVEDEGAANDE